MIISKIQGGIGNQLFQWAFAKNLSILNNNDFFLDVSFYENQTNVTKRKFSLGSFPKINFSILNPNDLKSFNVLEDNFSIRKIEINKDENFYLDGYWQSEKNFIESSKIIKEELSPTNEIKKKLELLLPKGINVSLHIRRTDYLSSNGFHPVLSIDYYIKSLNLIKDYDNIIIFSDDIEWCEKNLTFNNSFFIKNLSDVENLWLMSMCNHNIIANSSFSWWGAWLNDNPNKIITAPKKWFGSNINTENIIPNEWYKL
jgi:hypothetical protein